MKTKTFILVLVAVFAAIVGGVIWVLADGGGERRLGALTGSSIAGYEITFKSFSVNGLSQGGGVSRCSDGRKVLGGGVRYSSMNILSSSPAGDGGGWEVTTYNGGVFSSSARVYAVCAFTS